MKRRTSRDRTTHSTTEFRVRSSDVPPSANSKAMLGDNAATGTRKLLVWQGLTFCCMYLAYAGNIICRATLDISLPVLKEEGELTSVQAGVLLSAAIAVYLVGKLFSGTLADKFGGRRTLVVSTIGIAGMTVAFGFIGGVFLIFVIWCAARLFMSFPWTANGVLMRKWFLADSWGKAFGVLSTSSRLGAVVANYTLGAVLAASEQSGAASGRWRPVFYVAAAIAGAISVLLVVLLRESPSSVGLVLPASTGVRLVGDEKTAADEIDGAVLVPSEDTDSVTEDGYGATALPMTAVAHTQLDASATHRGGQSHDAHDVQQAEREEEEEDDLGADDGHEVDSDRHPLAPTSSAPPPRPHRQRRWLACPDISPMLSILQVMFSSSRFWVLCAAAFALTPVTEMNSLFPMILVDRMQIPASIAATISAMYPAGAAVGVLAGGALFDWFSRRGRLVFISSCLAVNAVVYFGITAFEALSPQTDLVLVNVILFVLGVATAPPYYLPSSIFSLNYGGEKHCGAVIGVIDAVGYSASMILFGLSGWLLDVIGWEGIFIILLVTSVVAWILYTIFFIAEYRVPTAPPRQWA